MANTGRPTLAISVSRTNDETSTAGGFGVMGGAAGCPTVKVPLMPSFAWPRTEQRNRKLPFRGKRTVSVWRPPWTRMRVLLFPTTKSCGTFPRFETTKRTVAPVGTERRESAKAKSFASTRIVTWAARGEATAPAHATAADRQAATTAIALTP